MLLDIFVHLLTFDSLGLVKFDKYWNQQDGSYEGSQTC